MSNTTFKYYQDRALETAKPEIKDNVFYGALGLCGEAGEVADKVKKIYRDKGGVFSDEDKEAIAKEVGDVLWYIAFLSSTLGVSMEDIADSNLEKLFSRKARGVISGSGDNR